MAPRLRLGGLWHKFLKELAADNASQALFFFLSLVVVVVVVEHWASLTCRIRSFHNDTVTGKLIQVYSLELCDIIVDQYCFFIVHRKKNLLCGFNGISVDLRWKMSISKVFFFFLLLFSQWFVNGVIGRYNKSFLRPSSSMVTDCLGTWEPTSWSLQWFCRPSVLATEAASRLPGW